MPKAKRMTRKQAIALCWSKFSPEVPMSPYWEKTIGERFRWAVDAVLATANDRPADGVRGTSPSVFDGAQE